MIKKKTPQFNYQNSDIPALEAEIYNQKFILFFFFQQNLVQDSAVQETCEDLDFKAWSLWNYINEIFAIFPSDFEREKN